MEKATALNALHKYEKLIDTIDGIVWEADKNIHFTFISKKAERLLGFPMEQWIEEDHFWENHLFPEDRLKTIAFCEEQCSLQLPHDFEYRFVCKDGTVKWLRDIVTIIKDKNEQFIGLRGVMVDVTDQKKLQEKYEKSLSILEATFEATADAIIVMLLDGSVQKYNQKFLTIWNIPEDKKDFTNAFQIIPFIAEQLVNPEDFIANIQYCFSHADTDLEELIKLKDGRYVERTSKPQLINGEIVGRVSSFRDVTKRVLFELERDDLLKKEMEARVSAEKSTALRDDFLSIASHELKTPLTPIKMQMRMIGREIKNLEINKEKSELLEKKFNDTEKQFNRFLKLVDELLDVTRITAGRLSMDLSDTDLSELCVEVATLMSEELERVGCALTKVIAPDIKGKVDKTRLWQVLNNILSNAVKYGAGSPVEFTLTKTVDDKGMAWAEFKIKDNGIGIPKEYQSKIFERFERVAPVSNYSGLGLGLFISQNIINAHGGAINVESEPEKGSTFTFKVPLAQ
jgi:PAS domain S-box-containing protein